MQTDFPARTLDRTFSVFHDEQTIYVDFHRSHPDTLLCFDAGLQRSGHSVYGGKIHAMQSWNEPHPSLLLSRVVWVFEPLALLTTKT